MTLTYHPPKATPLTPTQAADALGTALASLIGGPPTTQTLALAMAHTALETGRWKKLYNYNWGNIKAIGTYQGDYTCLGTLANPVSENIGGSTFYFIPTGEVTGPNGVRIGETFTVPPGHPQTRFRVYPDALAGAQRYVQLIGTTERYHAAWLALLDGDAVRFIHELKTSKPPYFTASEAPYAKAVVELQAEFLAMLGGATPPFKVGQPEFDSARNGWVLPLFF